MPSRHAINVRTGISGVLLVSSPVSGAVCAGAAAVESVVVSVVDVDADSVVVAGVEAGCVACGVYVEAVLVELDELDELFLLELLDFFEEDFFDEDCVALPLFTVLFAFVLSACDASVEAFAAGAGFFTGSGSFLGAGFACSSHTSPSSSIMVSVA